PGKARGGVHALSIGDDEQRGMEPQTPGALRVAAAWAGLLRSGSTTMAPHRLTRRASHSGPRRSQRGRREFLHGLLGEALKLDSRTRAGIARMLLESLEELPE